MSGDLAARVEQFLDAHHVMSLATVGDAGGHAACVMYARSGLALYWSSKAKTRHSQHIARDGRVTATVAPDYTDFGAIRGLQIAGRAWVLEAARDVEQARSLLTGRYAFLARLAAAPPELRAALEQASFYRLQPRHITLIDNTRGFGYKETLDLSAQ